MQSLGNHDPRSLIEATKGDINSSRRIAETVIRVEGKLLQFDNISRQRMRDVISSMEEGEEVEWFFYDNTSARMNRAELYDLMVKAESLMGRHTLNVFQRAKELKDALEAGDRVTMADLRLERWTTN
jgi:hypothetical protein